LRGIVFGDGPRRDAVLAAIAAAGAQGFVSAPGFVDGAQVREALAGAACHVLPSVREGYGLVVVEAAVTGTPSVVVRGADNAAAELVHDGVNGRVASTPAGLADAIVAVVAGGDALRRSTAAWFAGHAEQLSAAASARTIAAALAS
jgi:glycosyltransferase involved in cell wall biosynthesis